MPATVAVLAETAPGERRVALVPSSVATLTAAGLAVTVQAGAGAAGLAMSPDAADEAYREAGATVVPEIDLSAVDVLAHVRPLTWEPIAGLRPGAVTVGFCSPATQLAEVRALAASGVTALALELVPRISRAQSMDALTSQAFVAGYRAALLAATHLPRFLPLAMTAAGTVPPARVLVLGAGVAGLQAIATARRLGAVVSAYDVRAASADEVRSVGATFVDLDLDALEGAGGYAREMTEGRAARQRELLAPHVAAADALITTAAVPGRRAPLLVTAAMVAGMRPGSVVVDLAAESGGNVEGVVAGSERDVAVTGGTVRLVGMADAPSGVPVDASRLFSGNVTALLGLVTADGEVRLDLDDEVVAGACLTHSGEVRHAATARLLAPDTGSGTGGTGEGRA
ncbi:MAG: NAD(P) transhydrogenase subunit alpha [Kineosporiaceae bacterium]